MNKFEYVANPVRVTAYKITAVHEAADGKNLILTLESHTALSRLEHSSL